MTGSISPLPLIGDVLGAAADQGARSPLAGGLTAVVIPEPGRTLSISTHRRIYHALVPVTTQSFGADMTPYWADRSREGYLERLKEFVMVEGPQGEFVGWTGFHLLRYSEHTIVYLDSTGMVPAWQSRGVMAQLMHQRVMDAALPACAPDRPVFLTARSESPIFYRLMRRIVGPERIFPRPLVELPAEVARCGRDLAEWLGQQEILDPATLVLRNAYSGLSELYGELPSTGEAELDKLFRGELGPLDAYLLVGRAR